ncbi:hypothetical protein D6856_07775 [Butyrivibrio sp. XB500-5]|uniref:SH3 domain-containing protein n=1 Tax=Butyrivibrio sp. XB500-5 TaxID=2364880 RepID=UPI000EA97E92|nr:SH3 domain-containing protein [Butyrivibrio sp. XB500-5]RKM60937.1 hypothetical protein D6856_07775 [Butyrivibrio sp. XB500-5]
MKKTTGKRVFAFAIAIAMIVTMFLSAMIQAFAYTETTGTVSNDNVKVRESASTTASQVASLKKGDTIDIIGEETDSSGYIWYKIRVNKNEQGYVRSDLVNKAGGSSSSSNTNSEAPKKEEKASTPPAETKVTDVENKSAAVGYDNVVIRKGAGKDYDSVAKGTKGDSVTITGEAKGTDGKTWYRISFGDGKEGFIRGDLLDTSGNTQAAAPAPAESNEAPAAAPEESESEDSESEDAESESEDEESEEDSEESEDEEEQAEPAVVGDGTYALAYENETWYLNDYSTGLRVKVKELIDVANSAPALDKKAKDFKLIAIGLGALAGLLLIAVIILAIKLRESMYYEDDEEEEEYDRFSESRRRRARDDSEDDEEDRYSARRERPSRDEDRSSRRPVRPESSRKADDERVVRPSEDDRSARPSRNPEDRPARPRRGEEEYDRPSRRASEQGYDERSARPSRDSYKDEEREAPRRRAKNFIGDDDDFEFEFLDLDDEK